jgi:hypothetical protein
VSLIVIARVMLLAVFAVAARREVPPLIPGHSSIPVGAGAGRTWPGCVRLLNNGPHLQHYVLMAMRFNEAVRDWKSLPLTAGDIGDLDRLRSPGPGRAALAELSGSPLDGEVAEPDLLHAVFAVGLRVVQETADARAYAEAALARRAKDGQERGSGRDSPATSAGPEHGGRPEASEKSEV